MSVKRVDPSLRSTVPLLGNSSDKRQELRPLRALHNLLECWKW
jgi:hypothetical protein